MRYINARLAVIGHDLLMTLVSFILAFLVRFNLTIDPEHADVLIDVTPIILLTQGAILWWSRLYRGVWRFASTPDLWNIIRTAIFGALAVSLTLFLFNRLEGVPRATLILYPVFLIVLLGGPRLVYRIWKDRRLHVVNTQDRKRVLIIGAGSAGEMLARDMLRDGNYLPVGFLDDNSKLRKAKVHGILVLGKIGRIVKIALEYDVDLIVIAIPSATNSQMQRIVSLCEKTGIEFRTLPRLQYITSNQVINEIRDVTISDLLGRNPVKLDWKLISGGLAGKTVLVSGGGGSIGSELCRQIARLGPSELIIFEKSEFNLYSIDIELKSHFPNLVLRACLGDVCDSAAVEYVFNKCQPDIVFHAAAYKHVPMLQQQVREAIRNNVIGTKIFASAADKYKCKKFVMISTDKAVNPANVMGATKRAAEIFCQNMNDRSQTKFATVRFGNVLGSAGSVVPLFQRQIRKGGPVTVTHSEITRFFMTIPEASQLILQASVLGDGGEIFVLDMGESVKISYLAEQLIKLSGKEVGKDIEIQYTGLRPGEKLFEELFHENENLTETRNKKIMLSHSRKVNWENIISTIDKMEIACEVFDENKLKSLLKELVPELNESSSQMQSDNIVQFQQTNT